MDAQLKKALEEIINGFVKDFDKQKGFLPKRIVFCTDKPIKNEILLFNYLENRFLTTQIIIDRHIPILKDPDYD